MRTTIPYLIVIFLTLVACLSLYRVLKPELYLISIILLASIIFLSPYLSKGSLSIAAFATIFVALLIRSSFALASNFSVLPRGDGYRYILFTRYIHETGNVNASEEIFGSFLVHWPFLHILTTQLALIFNLDLYPTAQFVPPIVFGLINTIFAYATARLLCEGKPRNANLFIPLVVLFMVFNDFSVFSDTNYTGTSMATSLLMIILYLFLRANSTGPREVTVRALLTFFCALLVLTHPYQATIIPIAMMFFVIQFLLRRVHIRAPSIKSIRKDKELADGSTNRLTYTPYLTGTALFILQYLYIFYVTGGVQKSVISVLRSMFTIGFSPFERPEVGAWLESSESASLIFKTWWMDELIAQLAWFVTILFYALGVAGFIMTLLKKNYRERFYPVMSLSMAFVALFVIEMTLTRMTPDRVVHSAAPLLAIFAALAVTEVVSAPKKRSLRLFAYAALAFIILVYPFSAATSMGSRVHIPSYIYASEVSFEDKGMHSTYGPLTMAFLNSYANYESYNLILSDDSAMVRALHGTNASKAIGYVEGFLLNTEILDQPNNLVVVLLGLKPTYEGMRKLVMENLVADFSKLQEDARERLMCTDKFYDNGQAQVYFTGK